MTLAPPTLITGGTGFIGSRLLRHDDYSLVRVPRGRQGERVGDLLDIASLAEACKGIEVVFHCAGHAHAFASSNANMHWRINYEGTRNLAEAAGRAGVKRFVFLSSVKAMAEPGSLCVEEDWPGAPITSYGQSKRAAEDAVLEAGLKYGMHVVNLRLAMVYGHGGRGNLERMAKGISVGWFPPLPETGNRRSLVHIDDVTEAVRLVAERPESNGRTYIVANPNTYSGREIYDTIRIALDKSQIRWQVPEWLLRSGGWAGNVLGIVSNRTYPINSEIVERLLGSACYLPNKIFSELGWRARRSLEEGIREMIGASFATR